MTLGMIARCDNGGLGTLTWEAWRHLQPDRTLVVRCAGPACGSPHPDRYGGGAGEVRLAAGQPTREDARWLCESATVYSAETWYGMAARRCRTVLHVMPEYWDPSVTADLLLAPTGWEAPAGSSLLPVPVAVDRFERRSVESVETLYHISSPAQDRNGTRLLLAALPLLGHPVRVLIRQPGRGPGESRSESIGLASVEWLPHHDGPYWESWPAEADALVLPRRFAGLSLPMQEAAAQGLPVITLDRAPESDWLPAAARVPAHVAGRVVTWRGRKVDYWDADPAALAARIDSLVGEPDLAAKLSAASSAWADSLAWLRWLDVYREVMA
jgi:hypothetical protein